MGITEEVFEKFFEALEEKSGFPRSIIEKLKKLWESGETISQERILKIIKGGCEDASID